MINMALKKFYFTNIISFSLQKFKVRFFLIFFLITFFFFKTWAHKIFFDLNYLMIQTKNV